MLFLSFHFYLIPCYKYKTMVKEKIYFCDILIGFLDFPLFGFTNYHIK